LPEKGYPTFTQHRPLAPGRRLGLTVTDNSAAVGTMNGVAATTGLLIAFGQSFQILPERIARLSTLRKRNAVLFGSPLDSEALTKLLENAPLTIAYDEGIKEFVIVNRRQGKGLAAHVIPQKDETGAFTQVYGIVAVLQGDNFEGRTIKILLARISSIGTQGAAEYFTSATHVRALKTRLLQDGRSTFPTSYQVLVRSTLNRLSLLRYAYVGYVVI
jgi:hypothetical protein